jgi:hypothetical protein
MRYDEIELPPLEAGAVHDTVTVRLAEAAPPMVAVTLVGAPATPAAHQFVAER